MSIVCGTDFSEHASRALTAAAHLAARMKLPLHVAHSLELSAEHSDEAPREAYVSWAKRRLEQKAEQLRELGAEVTVHLGSGPPDETLLTLAQEVSAKLIVIAALGQRRAGKWHLGGHADRLAQRSRVPVLVVRDAAPFEAWVRGQRALRIALGADHSLTSAVAMRWVDELRRFGPCDVVALHLYWPPQQFQRLGLSGVRSYLEPDPEVTKTLERELYEHLPARGDAGEIKLRLEPNLGRVGDRIAALANDESVDLVVVGSHDRSSVARLWEGSVSHDVLHQAHVSVACIPMSEQPIRRTTPRVRNVVAATDFSAVGNAAIPLAYSVLEPGGTLHLVHIVKGRGRRPTEPHDLFESPTHEDDLAKHDALEQQMLSLIPSDTLNRNVATRLHVLQADDAAQAICQAAERLGADVVCMGTSGIGGMKTLLGSVTRNVLETTQRPVLLARKALE